jgi:hypothetical protein
LAIFRARGHTQSHENRARTPPRDARER